MHKWRKLYIKIILSIQYKCREAHAWFAFDALKLWGRIVREMINRHGQKEKERSEKREGEAGKKE